MTIISKLKLRLFSFLLSRGWQYHKKEILNYKGQPIYASKGAFFREKEKDDAWLYLLSRNHKTIVDVGCNIGQSSLLMTVGTKNQILCIDPNPSALSKCAENLIFNDLSTQARFICAFIGKDEGRKIKFHTITDGAAGSMFSSFAKTASGLNKSIIVNTKTLDTLCNELHFSCDLIKIDVEGAEQFVLQGIGSFVLQRDPDIFVEVHSGPELNIIDNTNSILDWCKENSYVPYYMKTHLKLKGIEEIKNRGRYHLLLLKQGKLYPDYLRNFPENATLADALRYS
jgi:FkbM family methyltransferase